MVARAHNVLPAADRARLHADWEQARALYEEVLAERPEDPDALAGLALTSWWLTGSWQEALGLRDRAYAELRRRGERQAAAGIAVALAEGFRLEGNDAAAGGWLARAERLLEEAGDCSPRGWLAIEQAKRSPDPAERAGHARRALDIARRLDDPDLEVAALSHVGLARTMAGDVAGGMAVLDEAMAAATGGEALDPLAIGEVCCMTLVACDRWADFRRAAEWCRVVVAFTERRNYTPLTAWCRTIYAGVLTALGDWARAEDQLVRSLQAYEGLAGGSRVYALAGLADLRIRQGRLEEAERLLEGDAEHPLAVAPVVALHLAHGEVELAAARLHDHVEAPAADPVVLARLLPLDVRPPPSGAIWIAPSDRSSGCGSSAARCAGSNSSPTRSSPPPGSTSRGAAAPPRRISGSPSTRSRESGCRWRKGGRGSSSPAAAAPAAHSWRCPRRVPRCASSSGWARSGTPTWRQTGCGGSASPVARRTVKSAS